jgi:stage II sporulation protein D
VDPARQSVRIGTTANGRAAILTLDLEDYIARVVAGEGEPRAADAAQQALAITARTFALANLNRHRREGFDFCDTTHCQVFRAATGASRRAALATEGRVLLHQGQPATVFYSALCGGMSELASNVWPGAVDYATAPVRDTACEDEPAWESDVPATLIEQALRDAGYRGGRLRGLRIISRTLSGRVARLQVEGFTPPEIAGHDFRMAVGRVAGWQRMKSTSFDVRRTGSGFHFRGRGSGHGVGLCVIGAGRRAAAGGSAADILRAYFPSLTVGTVVTRATTTAAAPASAPDAARAPGAAPPAAATRGGIRLALPTPEESERSRVVELVTRARDEIAAATATSAPAVITVTVHPTVEAFGRATGQPWWTSGATEGTAIDLLPLAILRQRGQVERTIRHEVAHVLIDAPLAGRPMWVREGLAAYFADPASASDDGVRGGCPKDEEFLRPISAGAHRAAYARAEACVRRALASGKAWRAIR